MSELPLVAFVLGALALIGGAVVVVTAVRSPVTTAVGAGLAAVGLAVELSLLGAPLVGVLQLTLSLSIAALVLVFGTRLVGTGEASLATPTWGLRLFKVGAATVALLLAHAIAGGRPFGAAETRVSLEGAIDARLLGQALFRDDLVVVGVMGLLLLVAIVGSIVLAAREPR